ncbi:MAG: hypothetical protein A3K19_09415 [Lentisphaerae bacterium RIFOXYB12_FULL_65_16]|nr:MAG: hypothetical protein A3K18_22430 [Lentisphaerae bacterium RIFOXYA12_64_32]OGV90413.1 MAG: hypothetical protein A3K19_09415 [Lentisphaerae bacterium RIFOXYB12_FULL_65_16]
MATPVQMPKQGNTVEECVITTWRKKKGDTVAEGEVMADIETDKATFELQAPASGQVLELFFNEGDLVAVLKNIAVIGQPGESVDAFRPDGAVAAAAPVATTSTPAAAPLAVAAAASAATPAPVAAEGPAAPLSPRAKRFVAEHPFQMGAIAGSGAGGRIIEKDVTAAYQQSARLSPVAAQMAAAGVATPAAGTGIGGMVRSGDMGKAAAPAAAKPVDAPAPAAPAAEVEIKPLSNIRKIIAQRMHESLATTAQFTLFSDADATCILNLRKRIKAGLEKKMDVGDINITDMVVYATILALKQYPALNATFIDGKVHQYKPVHMAVACDTPRGLMVPVIFNSDSMTLRQVAGKIKEYVTAANAGTINPDLLNGGSFTVSSIGAMGVRNFTPVLNWPQVAILGVGASELKPVRRGDEVVFVDYLNLSLTINHQIIDGAPGARFLQTLRNIIENFDMYCVAR